MITSIESCTATSKGPDDKGPVVEDARAVESPSLAMLLVVEREGSRCMNSDASAFKAFLAAASNKI
jgi:hypothetical protein